MNDHHEARLLLAILREDWTAAGELVEARVPQAGSFLDLTRRCDVGPWIHAVLERADRSALVEPQIWDELGRARHKCRVDNVVLLARAEQALDLLLRAGIVPVALKGLDFIQRFYERFDQRTMDDVDLLVHPRQLTPALEILENAGFSAPRGAERQHWLRSSYEIPLTSPGPAEVLIELHWGLAQERRYRVSVEPVLERALPLEVSGRRILRLDDHDAAAHVLLHHLQHYFDRRLKWMVEFVRIVESPGFDWSRLARLLEAWGGRGAAGLCLAHVIKLFPGSVPRQGRLALPAAAWRRALTLPLRSRHPLDLFRRTRERKVQLFLAAALLERPRDLPGYLLHRKVRDRSAGAVERAGAGGD